jgi:hypothetical protein
MKSKPYSNQDGSTLICALCTILIISLIGANVLLNCTTRYNVSSKQVKGWKEALYAAEGGGDIAFSEVRKLISSPSTAFLSSGGWTTTAGPSYSNGPYSFGQNNSLSANVTVDQLTATLSGQPQFYYRIRSKGTATLLGLPRVGMDDRMNNLTKGDSLLRKIDFKYDHFKAAYGDGDGNGKAIQTVPYPQITRRIETIAVPQLAVFTGGLEVGNAFAGPGHAGLIDSYNSKNGAYPGASIAANPVPPGNPNYNYYIYSRQANVSVGTASFTDFGPIYGNVSTNGGNVTHSGANISGTIDNTAPFTIAPLVIPNTGVGTGFATGSGTTLDLPTLLSALPAGTGTTPLAPATYVYSSLSSGLTINGLLGTDKTLPSYNKPIETYVTIVVGSAGSTTGDIGGITIGKGVNAKIYFTGSLNVNASALVNNNVDGAAGVYNADGSASSDYSQAGHLQFYGVSPTDGSTQSVAITPGGGSNKDVYATIYAPSANVSVTGNVNWYGAIVASIFTGNGNGGGNTSFHYDTQIAGDGVVTDYQIASYIEDIR